ncbi:hypothetical protein [Brumimicrobium sp.]|uniref:hypothetical protein n=1 Tax=Brumimicrobium sp. TaxID=2029867 RepID=UPI003A9200C2
MKQTLTILTLFLHFVGLSQDWLTDKEELKGNVKSVQYHSTTYISEDEEDWWIEDCEYRYNEQGFLIESSLSRKIYDDYQNGIYRIFDETGTYCLVEYEIRDSDTASATKFKYDSLNRVIEEFYYRNDFSNTFYKVYDHNGYLSKEYALIRGRDTSSNIYQYDDLGRKIKDIDTSYSCVIVKTWKYDVYSNIIQEKSDLKKAPKTTIFTINEDGTREKKVLDNNPDDDRNYQIDYSYNDLNQIVHEIRKYLDGRVQYDVTYEYNQNGDIIVKSYLDLENNDNGRVEMVIEYEYDSKGNWISRTSYYEDTLDQEETRKIEYY